MKFSAAFPILGLYLATAFAATAEQWKGRAIYQIVTDRFATSDGSSPECNTANQKYCGGTWRGITTRLDYIQGLGFSAIWISPVVKNIDAGDIVIGDPYHGYWQNDINALNSHFGTEDDLRALSDAVHSRGMYLMVDIVTNHMAWPGNESSVNYGTFQPFNESFYYHPYCQVTQEDYSLPDQTALETCWLGDQHNELVDLNTTRSDVIRIWNSWITNLISSYLIDGLRIDTVKHVQKDFWLDFCAAAGVYCMGEVADGNLDYICSYQNVMDGLVNYPLYYVVLRAMQEESGNMTALVNNINGLKFACKDSNLLAPFSENHDRPRIPTVTSDSARVKNIIAFTLLADGIPILYYGQEQFFQGGADPANREALWDSGYDTNSEFYQFTAKVMRFRNYAASYSSGFNSYSQLPLYHDNNTVVLLKGDDGVQVVSVFSNFGLSSDFSNIVLSSTRYNPGDRVVEIVECIQTTVDVDGLHIINTGFPQVWYAEANLAGSGICGK